VQDLQQRFRQHPGCRERHLRRKLDNPLFPPAERQATVEQLTAEQRRDDDELNGFLGEVKTLVSRVGALSPDSELAEIDALTRRADAYYERCLGLPGDQRRVKSALIKLIAELTRLNMQTMRDSNSLLALQDEQVQRLARFTRLEFALTGDLCREQSPIREEELAATLLSEPPDAVAAALNLFDHDKVTALRRRAADLVARGRQEGFDVSRAESSLAAMAKHLQEAAA